MSLSPPPLDGNNLVVSHDHAEILNTDDVIRRISRQHVVPDPKVLKGNKVSTMAFQASTGINGGMSIDLKTRIEADGLDAKLHVTSPEWIGSVVIDVQFLRGLELKVGYDPLPNNAYHGEVWGNFSKSIQKQILSSAIWFVEIPSVYLNEKTN